MVNRRVNINLQSQIDAVMNAQQQALASANTAMLVSQAQATARPSSRPTFMQDWANSRYFDPKLSISRLGVSTYIDKFGVIKKAGANTPRFNHDFETKESLGLMMETARTNLFTYSEDLTNSAWIKTRCSVVANTKKGIYRTTTQKLICDGSTDPYLSQILTGAFASKTVTFSVYLWSEEPATTKTKLMIYGNNGIEESAIITIDVTNKPKRFSITKTFTAGFSSTSITARIDPFDDETNTPANGRFLNVECPQLEEGLFASSFIPTSATTVYRGQDYITLQDASFYEMFPTYQEGTMFINAVKGKTSGSYSSFWGLNGPNTAGGQNAIRITNLLDDTNFSASIYKNGVVVSYVPLNKPAGTNFMCAMSWKEGDSRTFIDGVGTVATTPSIPDNINKIGLEAFDGHLKQICFYPKRLSDAELQAITTLTLSGKNSNQLPTNSDLAGGGFVSPYSILRRTGKQEIPIDGTGASFTRNIRRPYPFSFELVETTSSTISSQPPVICEANTDYSLTFNCPTGKSLVYSITPTFD